MVWFSFYGKFGRREELHKGLALIRDGVNLSIAATLFSIWSSSTLLQHQQPLKFDEKEISTTGFFSNIYGRLFLALFQTCVCLGNFVWNAAVREEEDVHSWRTNSFGFGKTPFGLEHLGFFTSQSLFIILLYQWFSVVAVFLKDGLLAQAVNNFRRSKFSLDFVILKTQLF